MTTPNGHKPQPKPEMTLAELELQCHSDSGRWFPETQQSIPHHALAMCGEVGEFANIVKKIERGDRHINESVTRHDLAMELTDVFIYVLNLGALLQVNLYEAYKVKRNQNDKRFLARLEEKKQEANKPKLIVPGQG